MSNQVGDRYTCADPSCGCEIEVKQACAAGQDDKSVRRDYREDEPMSSTNAGDGGSDHVHTEGRYDSKLPRATRTSGDASQLGGNSPDTLSGSPRCFCGSRMREVGSESGVGRTFAAGV